MAVKEDGGFSYDGLCQSKAIIETAGRLDPSTELKRCST